jgi:hypothetical protein
MPLRAEISDAPEAVALQWNQFAARGMGGSHGWYDRHSEACSYQLEDAGKLVGFEYGAKLRFSPGAGHQHILAQAVTLFEQEETLVPQVLQIDGALPGQWMLRRHGQE